MTTQKINLTDYNTFKHLKNVGGIYKIISPSNKIYIGKSINLQKRFSSYKGMWGVRRQHKLKASLEKYGLGAHEVQILEYAEDVQHLKILEIDYIQLFNSCSDGLNCTLGGEGNLKYIKGSEEYLKNKERLKEKNRIKSRDYNSRPEVKQYRKEYYKKPEVKEKQVLLLNKPGRKEKRNEYFRSAEAKKNKNLRRATPEYQAKIREYNSRPEVIQRKLERRSNPLFKEKMAEYNKKWYSKPEIKLRKQLQSRSKRKPPFILNPVEQFITLDIFI